MDIENTRDRAKVESLRKHSLSLVNQGLAEEHQNWDIKSPWHNSKYVEKATGNQWVIYLPDQAWPGEVKVLNAHVAIT